MRQGHRSLSDDELEKLLKEEKHRLSSGTAKERIVARRVIRELELEQARRYEAKFGLS
jgi:hypothetical protein